MDSFVVCPKRDSKKVNLKICLEVCKTQWGCAPFNEEMFLRKQEEAEKLAEMVEPIIPEEEKKSNNTDVQEETSKRVLAVQTRSKAQELYEQVLALKSEIEVRWFELGKILQEIFEGRHYIDLGYATWRDFCEVALGPLELRWRTADYLRTTVMKCKEVGIKKEIAGQIGWSKLKEIVPVVTEKNKEEWVKKAKKKGVTVQILNALVRVAQGKITEKEAEKLPSKLFFSLYEEQLENVERTLELAGRMTGSNSRGYQLEMVCADFRGTYESPDGEFLKGRIISDLLRRIEAVMKVKFKVEAVDVETGEIIFEIP